MTEVQKPSVIYEDNQGEVLIANNRQVGMRTKNINIRHHFLRDMVEYKDIGIKYIWSEKNPAYIMTKNTSIVYLVKHMKKITEGELWEIVETGRGNAKNTRATDYIVKFEKTEYYFHSLSRVVGVENRND